KKILYDIENDEYGLRGASFALPKDLNASGKKHVQLHLFSRSDHFIIEKLQKLDISKMTPLDALNYLNELQEKSKTIVL
ncbi:MAG: hypothetical protein JRF17_04115, partial [Deltaproteobacteria bacterium]|nr:hypothetical protein [Deltaproteobacteria bacterium]